VTTFTATLCGADGRRAGCGSCVRPKGHPVGQGGGVGGENHRDAEGAGFFVIEKCPFCVEVREEGAALAAHVRDAHGGAVVVEPVEQLGLFGACT